MHRLLDLYLPSFSPTERRYTLGLLALGMLLILLALSHPHVIVFDETYFANFANELLKGKVEFDIHPPLGKALIAIGIAAFHFNQFGYRIVVALFGCLTLLILPPFLNRLFGAPRTAILGLGLFIMHGFFLAYARLALLETFMLFFSILSLYCLLVARQTGDKTERQVMLLVTGLVTGLALSIKWIAAGVLPLLWLWWFLWPTKRPKVAWWLLLLAFVIIPLVIYIANFLLIFPFHDFWHALKEWHLQSWDYNVNLKEHHPYGSYWWTWPFEIRPIWFHFTQYQTALFGSTTEGIIGLGHPLIWWSSTVALLVASLKSRLWGLRLTIGGFLFLLAMWTVRSTSADLPSPPPLLVFLVIIALLVTYLRDHWTAETKPNLILLLSWAVFFLPWVPITRVLFLYHYLFPAFFALLLLTKLVDDLLESKKGRDLAIVGLTVSAYLFIFWLPLWTAYPIPSWFYQMHTWFRSWI